MRISAYLAKYPLLFMVFTLLIGGGCSKSSFIADEESLVAYHEQKTNAKGFSSAKEEMYVYIDYSDGMYTAINKCFDFFETVLTILDRNSSTFFRVGKGDFSKIDGDIFDVSNPYNPRKKENFAETHSNLDGAVDEIINHSQTQSIFITDFELVKDNSGKLPVGDDDNESAIDFSPWAVKPFESWLKEGNSIDVFAKSFDRSTPRGVQTQYLYFIIFTPKALLGLNTKQSILTRMEEEGFMNQGESNIKWMGFGKGKQELTPAYKEEELEQGGLHIDLSPYDYFDRSEKKYEFYQISMEEVQKVPRVSDAKANLIGELLFHNTYSNFTDVSLEVKCEDITDEFIAYTEGYEGENAENAPDIFSLHRKDDKVGLRMNPNFLGLSRAASLYRVDLYLTDAKLVLDEVMMDSILKWTDDRGFDVSSLKESIREGMKRQEIEEQLLYTYYIELLNQ